MTAADEKNRKMMEEMLLEHRAGMTEQERNEHNAVAWLVLTDRELVQQSASLDLPGDLHPDPTEESGRLATYSQLAQARFKADSTARELAGDKFVDDWLAKNRKSTEDDDYVSLP
jgi:hypothetical protein